MSVETILTNSERATCDAGHALQELLALLVQANLQELPLDEDGPEFLQVQLAKADLFRLATEYAKRQDDFDSKWRGSK